MMLQYKSLNSLGQIKNNMTEYITEHSGEDLSLVGENVENLTLIYAPGLSTGSMDDLSRPRERDAYMTSFLNLEIAAGRIGDGVRTKFDDRKFRFHSASLHENGLELQIGVTHYKECADCRKWSEGEREQAAEVGRRVFHDSSAFFTRGCGIEATPITSDGSIFVGKRKVAEEASGYAGMLSAVNGWVDYKERLEDLDFKKDVAREL